MKRGEIYYIEKYRYDAQGSEQTPGRPAIIVSNDKCNTHSDVVEIVYLTTSPKTDLPTHIDIRSAQRQSIALCEQITSISVDRIGDYIGQCSEYEMVMVDAALAISLGLDFDEPNNEASAKVEKEETASAMVNNDGIKRVTEMLIKVETERDTYKALYENLFERMVAR